MITGLFAHELGHVLYTDFLITQTYLRYLECYKWFPVPPELKTVQDADNERAFWDFVKTEPRNMELAQHIASYIANILEDGYVENCILNQFPGVLGFTLTTMREHQFAEMLTVSEMIEKEDDGESHIFSSILQILLSYAKFGEIKYGGTPLTDERIQTVFKLIPQIDTAVVTSYPKERWKIVSLIMI